MSTSLLTTLAELEALPEIEGKRELTAGEVAVTPPTELARSQPATRSLERPSEN